VSGAAGVLGDFGGVELVCSACSARAHTADYFLCLRERERSRERERAHERARERARAREQASEREFLLSVWVKERV
jgi:hypothetical protein